MTISNEDYLTLASIVYASSDENRLLTPAGWAPLGDITVGTAGFRAGVYSKGNEIVISYCGTDAVLADTYFANTPGYRGTYSEQFVQAMQLYETTRRANPSANITFTGHSLGGGLAGVMGVYFNRTAITFDAAPFQASATTLATVQRYAAEVAATLPAGTALDPQLTGYIANAGAMATQFSARESNVTQINLQNEFLNLARSDSNTIAGAGQSISIPNGTQTVTGVTLHSIRLLSAMYRSAPFAQAVRQSPQVLEWLTSSPYGQATTSTKPDLITALTNAQSLATALSLNMLGNDLQRIFGLSSSGVFNAAQLPIAQKAAYWYYLGNPAPSAEFTTAVAGGLSFNINSSFTDNTGKAAFLQEVSRLAGSSATFNITIAQRVTFANGAMTVTLAGDIRDVVFGSNQNDTLDGGGGNDLLLGGRGNDTYIVGSGTDVIRDDAAGEGVVRTELGRILNGGKGSGQRDRWIGTDGETYSYLATQIGGRGTLTITEIGTGGMVIIENFDLTAALTSTGYLGIKLDPTQRVALIQGTAQSLGASTSNVYADLGFNTASLAGQSSQFNEGGGKTFSINLAVAAHAGDTITLSANGAVAGNLQAVLGDSTVAANGAVITLAEGQTQVSFALVSSSAIEADVVGVVSASYAGVGTGTATRYRHYKKRSCSRNILLGWRAKKPVKMNQISLGEAHA